jgi:hypothetical protein
MEPHPPGTLVVAITPEGIPLRQSCVDHLFEVGEVFKRRWSDEVHLLQTSRCIVCDDEPLAPLEADWFFREATAADIDRCVAHLTERLAKLERVRDRLTRPATARVLRNIE